MGTQNALQALTVTTDGSTKYVTTYTGLYFAVVSVTTSAGTQPTFQGGATLASNASAVLTNQGTVTFSGNPPTVGATLGSFTGSGASSFYAEVT